METKEELLRKDVKGYVEKCQEGKYSAEYASGRIMDLMSEYLYNR